MPRHRIRTTEPIGALERRRASRRLRALDKWYGYRSELARALRGVGPGTFIFDRRYLQKPRADAQLFHDAALERGYVSEYDEWPGGTCVVTISRPSD